MSRSDTGSPLNGKLARQLVSGLFCAQLWEVCYVSNKSISLLLLPWHSRRQMRLNELRKRTTISEWKSQGASAAWRPGSLWPPTMHTGQWSVGQRHTSWSSSWSKLNIPTNQHGSAHTGGLFEEGEHIAQACHHGHLRRLVGGQYHQSSPCLLSWSPQQSSPTKLAILVTWKGLLQIQRRKIVSGKS